MGFTKMKCFVWIFFTLLLIFSTGCGRQKAPDVSITELSSGKKRSISSFKGKVVLIDAWATWCGPCRESMPIVQKMYNEFGSKGLEVVAVSAETTLMVESFVRATDYTYPFYVDTDNSFQDAYKITEIPKCFLIGKDGTIVYQGHPGDEQQLRNAIEAALR